MSSGKDCTRMWKRLKLYINGIFEGEEARRIQYDGAGWEHYQGAAAQSWQDVNDLMQSGSNYIAANLAALKGVGNNNMPDSFPAAFNLAWTTFNTTRDEFTDALNASQTGTADKVNEINSCYAAAINMGTDGQEVFQADEELKRLFSFEAMGAIVAPAGPASFEMTVVVNGAPKAGAEVSIEGTDKEAVTGADGKALFLQMHEGPLQARVECDGYTQQLVSETIEAGVRKRVTVTLQPLFDGAFTVGSEKTEAAAASGSEMMAAASANMQDQQEI